MAIRSKIIGGRVAVVTDHLIKRFTLLKKIEYFIEESVYYRAHSESMHSEKKVTLLKKENEIGKILVK